MSLEKLLDAVESSNMEAEAKADTKRIIENHYDLREP